MTWYAFYSLFRAIYLLTISKALSIIEDRFLRGFILYNRPQTREADIPHRTMFSDFVLEKHQLVKALKREKFHSGVRQFGFLSFFFLLNRFQEVPGQISYTFDGWSSRGMSPYVGITAHYIEVSKDHPNEWKLVSDLVAFTVMEGRHTGANYAAMLLNMLDEYKIRDKVSPPLNLQITESLMHL